MLAIPTVLDRVIGQAVQQVLTPVFDPEFCESSFGFRPGRSAHGAVRQVQRHIGEGYRVAVDLDLWRSPSTESRTTSPSPVSPVSPAG